MFSKKTVENLIKRISQKALTNRVCYDIISAFQIWRHGQAVRQRSATPLSPVRFRVAPPKQKAPNRVLFRFGEVTWCEERYTSPPAASVLGHDSGWRLQKKENKSKDLLSFFSEIRLRRVKFGFAKWNSFAVKYLLRKCEIFADANVGKFHFTSNKVRYFTIHEVNYFTFGKAEYFTNSCHPTAFMLCLCYNRDK